MHRKSTVKQHSLFQLEKVALGKLTFLILTPHAFAVCGSWCPSENVTAFKQLLLTMPILAYPWRIVNSYVDWSQHCDVSIDVSTATPDSIHWQRWRHTSLLVVKQVRVRVARVHCYCSQQHDSNMHPIFLEQKLISYRYSSGCWSSSCWGRPLQTRKPCYRKDDRAMRPMYTYKLFTLIVFTLTVTLLCADFDSEGI